MKKLVYILAITLLSMGALAGGMKAEEKQPETMPLVTMMQMLLINIQTVDQGIYNEDYSVIEEGAQAIAEHPAMTEEDKMLVKETLGGRDAEVCCF